MKKIIFGYTSMAITLVLSITIPNVVKLNEYTATAAGFVGAFNLIISGVIIFKGHSDLGNLPKA